MQSNENSKYQRMNYINNKANFKFMQNKIIK